MKPFQRSGETVHADFEPLEARVLADLATQVAAIVGGRDHTDPVMERLLPDAYPDDAEASAEFRRFTADGLAERKVANAGAIAGALERAGAADSTTRVELDPPAAQAWLRGLTDIRLTVASRLGIEHDEDAGADDPVLRDLYDWLGFVQDTLVEAVSAE